MSNDREQPQGARSTLPILDEVGRTLHREFAEQERLRRRRIAGAGLGAALLVIAVALTVGLTRGSTTPSEPIPVARVRAHGETVRLVLAKSDSGVCLEPDTASGQRRGPCVDPTASTGRRTAVAASIDGATLVYGIAEDASRTVRLTVDGRPRDVPTATIPSQARSLADLPDGLRVYLVALEARPNAVTVEPQRPGTDSDTIIRIPQPRADP